jgi:hypothetical protein
VLSLFMIGRLQLAALIAARQDPHHDETLNRPFDRIATRSAIRRGRARLWRSCGRARHRKVRRLARRDHLLLDSCRSSRDVKGDHRRHHRCSTIPHRRSP